MLDFDLKCQAVLTLDTFVGVREEVVGSHNSQRNGKSQRFVERIAFTAVDERVVVGIIGGAVQVRCLVVCKNHTLVRIRIENEIIAKAESLSGSPRRVICGGCVAGGIEKPSGGAAYRVITVTRCCSDGRDGGE